MDEESGIEELNPFASNIDEHLKAMDEANKEGAEPVYPLAHLTAAGCYQLSCPIYVDVDKATQTLRLYLDGRIYDRYTSSKYPGGDYNGLGNMPYAMFISGGIAIHGTPRGNWPRLARLHPLASGQRLQAQPPAAQ